MQSISDEYLEKVYSASSCLIAASINEGFGLSIIEAARYGMPIIARDIAIFREVAGDNAYYFSGLTSENLADSLKEWIKLYKLNYHPKSENISWLTWEESANQLEKLITSKVQ